MQLSTETFILDGKCYTPAIAERNYSRLEQFRPNIIEDGGTIPAPLDTKMREAIDDLILRGAAAIGVTEGIVKGDIVIDEMGKPLIIELALRLSGGRLAVGQPAMQGESPGGPASSTPWLPEHEQAGPTMATAPATTISNLVCGLFIG